MSHMDAASRTAQERSTGDLVKSVTEQVSVLMRDELKLAQLEMTGKAKQAGKGMGMMGGGALIALYGVACLIACVIIAISHSLQAWLSALIVAAVVLAVAGVAAVVGKKQVGEATPVAPEKAVAGAKLDVATIKGDAHE